MFDFVELNLNNIWSSYWGFIMHFINCITFINQTGKKRTVINDWDKTSDKQYLNYCSISRRVKYFDRFGDHSFSIFTVTVEEELGYRQRLFYIWRTEGLMWYACIKQKRYTMKSIGKESSLAQVLVFATSIVFMYDFSCMITYLKNCLYEAR